MTPHLSQVTRARRGAGEGNGFLQWSIVRYKEMVVTSPLVFLGTHPLDDGISGWRTTVVLRCCWWPVIDDLKEGANAEGMLGFTPRRHGHKLVRWISLSSLIMTTTIEGKVAVLGSQR